MSSPYLTRGGTALLAASVLLVIATIGEIPLLGHSHPGGAAFWIFLVTFELSSVGYLVAALLLGVGAGAIAARSTLARVGLIAFGVFWLVAQTIYLFGSYLTPSDGLLLASTLLSILMLIGGLIAGITIGARALVRGAGRWILLIVVVISGVTGAIAGGSTAIGLVTALHLVSAVGLAIAGLVYLLARPGRDANAYAG